MYDVSSELMIVAGSAGVDVVEVVHMRYPEGILGIRYSSDEPVCLSYQLGIVDTVVVAVIVVGLVKQPVVQHVVVGVDAVHAEEKGLTIELEVELEVSDA